MPHDPGPVLRALHRPGNPFTLANAWDRGSAQMLVAMGAEAIATSSAAHAFTIGKPDMGYVTRDEALTHASDLVAAVNVPVSGDFENGYGTAPETVAETIRYAATAGLAGCSIEDTDMPGTAAYDFDLAVERIRAAAAAARALPKDFVLVARADGVMNGAYDMAEALRRIRAFDAAGADCLYVPLPPDMAALKSVVEATRKPVNALAAGRFIKTSRAEFAAAGIARISLGGALARVTHKVILDAGTAIFDDGDFSLLKGASGDRIDALLEQGKR